MKRFAFIVMAAAALFSACTEEGTGNGGTNTGEPLMADFTISVNPATVGEEVTFAGKAEGGIDAEGELKMLLVRLEAQRK